MIGTSLQKINVDVRIGRESALLSIITIKLPASIGEKSTSEKTIHADPLLTTHFNKQMYDFSVKCSSAFCESYILFFSFLFPFSKLYCHRGDKRKKKRKKNFRPSRTRTQDLSVFFFTCYLLSYRERRPLLFLFACLVYYT